jgi:N-acetylneuraminic acid mutarotase
MIIIATELWTLIESESALTPSPRDSHILVNSGNSIFLFGGSTVNPRSDFYEYRIDDGKWVPVSHKGGKSPTSRFCHVGVVVKKKFYIFGGYDGDSRLNDFYYFLIDDCTFDIP